MAKQTFTTGQVLTAAQMTSLQQTAMLGGAASAKTASYTLVAADAGTAITMSNASATTITVNTALFAAGDTVQITNLGAGVCTITAGTATVNTSASLALAQYESGTLDFTSTSAAIFIKGAGAAAASGSMTLLSTTTMSGATTTISSISGSYKNLYVEVSGATFTTGAASLTLVFNSPSLSHILYQVPQATTITGSTEYLNDGIVDWDNTSTNNFFTMTIYDYASSTNYKNLQITQIYKANGAGMKAYFAAGGLSSTTAITSLIFGNNASRTSTAGTIKVYGVN